MNAPTLEYVRERFAYDQLTGAISRIGGTSVERERVARIINPDLFVEYDLLVKKGTLAENGSLWADVVFGRKIAALYVKADEILTALRSVEAGTGEPVAGKRISQLAADLVVSGWMAGDHGIEEAKKQAERKLLDFACDEISRHLDRTPSPAPAVAVRAALEATLEALTTNCSPSTVLGAINLAKAALSPDAGGRGK